MLRGALLGLLLVSAVTDASAQDRAPTTPLQEREAVDKPLIDGKQPVRPNPAVADEPPPSAYDRARQDGGQTPDQTSLVGQLVKTMVALAFVCGIIWVIFKFGAARLLPGAMGPRDGRIVRVVERVMVDQKSSILIVDVGPDRMMLGCAEGGISLITKLGASQPATDTTRGGPPGFRAVLDAFSPKKNAEDDNGTT